MKFLDVVRKLQKENKGYIVFVRCGIFFSTVGKDAVIINKLFSSKPVCIQEKVCKCGIPVNTFKNYIPNLNKIGYSYVVYDYDKNSVNNEYREIARVNGKMIEENAECLDCKTCWQSNNRIVKNIDNALKIIEEMLNGNK